VSSGESAGVVKDHGAFSGPFLELLDPKDEGNAFLGYAGNHSHSVKTLSTGKHK